MVPIQRREARRKRVGRVDHPTIRHGKPSVSGVGSINHCRGIGIPIVNSCKLNRKDFFPRHDGRREQAGAISSSDTVARRSVVKIRLHETIQGATDS